MGELLAGLPALFGFAPRESLIAVSLEGDRHRLGFRLRIDLPPPEHHRHVADYLSAVLERNKAGVVLLVACSDTPVLADPLMHQVCDRLTGAGVHVVDAVRCDGARYWSYLCGDQECCPPEGRDYDATSSVLVAEAVASGMEVLPDRSLLARRLAPVGGQPRRAMAARAAQVRQRVLALLASDPTSRSPSVDALRLGASEVKAILRRATGDPGHELDDEEVALLSVWCEQIVVRDVAWSQMTGENAGDHLRVWSQAARRVVPPSEPAVLALAGFAAWLSGDGALAWCAVDRLEVVAPAYSMGELLRETLVLAVPPTLWAAPPEELLWEAAGQR